MCRDINWANIGYIGRPILIVFQRIYCTLDGYACGLQLYYSPVVLVMSGQKPLDRLKYVFVAPVSIHLQTMLFRLIMNALGQYHANQPPTTLQSCCLLDAGVRSLHLYYNGKIYNKI